MGGGSAPPGEASEGRKEPRAARVRTAPSVAQQLVPAAPPAPATPASPRRSCLGVPCCLTLSLSLSHFSVYKPGLGLWRSGGCTRVLSGCERVKGKKTTIIKGAKTAVSD